MPECLQPERLIRRYGLRKNVIRALYHMYEPFVDRIKPITTFEEHPDCLKSYECHLIWHTIKSSNYIYFFKMRRKILNPSLLSHSKTRSEMPDLLEILDDISANPDEHCRILEVSCLHFSPVPPVLGTWLNYCYKTIKKKLCRFGPKIGHPDLVLSPEIPLSQVAAGVRFCRHVIIKLTRGRW